MESESLLEKIKSKYIANHVIDFIKDKNYLLKLAKYCKILQSSFKLGLEDYKNKGYEIINCSNFENFLYVKRSSKFKANYLKNKFKEEFKKYDESIRSTISDEFSEKYFINKYYKNNDKTNKNISDNQLIIDIQSPFYESLSKKVIFQNLFIIRLPFPLIKEHDLIKDYLKEFEQLNKSNANYSALCFQFDTETKKFSNFQKLNIDFKKIKKLIFEEKAIKSYNKSFSKYYIKLFPFKTIFLNNDIVNNLVFLEIKNLRPAKFLYDLDSAKINSFKSLEELRLENVKLESDIILKLCTLKYLALCHCDQIEISEKCALNLKSLSLFRSRININNSSSYLKFPELEQLKISFCFYNENHSPLLYLEPYRWFEDFRKKIDFKSLNKLKFLLRGDISLFLSLENNSLEKAYISSYTTRYSINEETLEKNMIKKFIDIKSLKEIKLSLYYIKSNTLKSINGENNSVKKLIVDFHKEPFSHDNADLLNNVQKKFPNITELEIYDYASVQKINLASNCKLEKLKYSRCVYQDFLELSIYSFENLKELELRNIYAIKTQYNNDDFYNNFKSLVKFQLNNSNINVETDLKFIKNIIENINKIPNLKCFILKCFSDIKETEYIQIIKKVLELKIKSIEFGINSFTKQLQKQKDYLKEKLICNKEYTEHELHSFSENIDFEYFENIKIYKFNN